MYFLAPVLLGGCRPISLTEYLPSAGFTITERRRIAERAIPAEVIQARKQMTYPGGRLPARTS